MRPLAAVCLVVLVGLAGCSVGYTGPAAPPDATDTPASTPEATPATPDATVTPTPAGAVSPPDPETDTLGWESGRWANETLAITRSDGLNESERRAVVDRAMARVELVRGLEFRERVPVEVVTRAEYRNSSLATSGEVAPAFRRFDNAKFEAMFLVGEENDSLAVQSQNRGSSVAGFYSPRNDTIVIISEQDPPDLPGERTLGHELVHALQDQYYNLSTYRAPTRMAYNGQNGLIEGDANLVQRRYEQRCSEEWDCLAAPAGGGGGGSDFHLGIYILNFFPYSDGPGFVGYYEKRGGWERVNELYDRPPASDEQVIYPPKYGEDAPTDAAFADETSEGWSRVRPEPRRPTSARPDYASLGQSGLTAMFAYTLYDPENRSGTVVAPGEFLNTDGGQVNRTDPFNYDLAYTSGWDGDRLHVYRKGDRTGYVWRIEWDDASEAREFAGGYERLLAHYGGEPVAVGDGTAGSTTVYRIPDGPYADAFRVTVEGDTVTIVNAPTTDALSAVGGSA
ncbi:Hvo_1808 family surface protein [Halorarius halobius]|uniref:Hvo_1808 family surface protein n=1 Tax=Halorarius halobius TaxID=2962671 RepID=UPI0020CCE3A5|nr:Hvo_1808 family surface protein [Halorarius halobius]